MFEDFSFDGFWQDSDYAEKENIDEPPTDETVRSVERALGYRLPASYVTLARYQNGGRPKNTYHRTSELIAGADYVTVTHIFSIGSNKRRSLCGEFGNQFWLDEWGYPDIGIYFASCPSGGHELLCLDYRNCGPTEEPQVVHVDQEFDYKVTFVAESFEAFIRGLEHIDFDEG